MGITPNSGFRWQRQGGTGKELLLTKSGSATPPNAWARLVRTGNTLYGYKSTDGANWTLVNASTIPMASNIYIGLVVASGSTNVLNSSTFSNVIVVP